MKACTCVILVIFLVSMLTGIVAGQDSWDGTAGLLRVYEAGTIGKGKLVFSMGSSYYRRGGELITKGPRSFIRDYYLLDEAEVDYNFFISRVALTLGLSDYIEFSTSLDVRNWIMQVDSEDEEEDFETRNRGGIGDTELMLKLCPPMPVQYVRAGVLGQVRFPTGNEERRFGTEKIDFGVKGLLTLDFTDTNIFVPTKLHVNAGYRFNKNEEQGYGILYPNNPDVSGFYYPGYPVVPEDESDNFNDAFEFGTGIEFLMRNVRLFCEFKWDNFMNADIEDGDTLHYIYNEEDTIRYRGYTNPNVYTISPGVSITSEAGVGVLAAFDFNLNSEDDPSLVDPPDWAVYFAISYSGFVMPQDRDHDGIEDKVDKCPDEAEDVDGFEDDDGCIDRDNDGDGIEDGVDQCPDLAEDFDGFEDEDGCPDYDNDGDGIQDIEDRCPNEPEDFDGTEDSDGCPDVMEDSDADGIPDDMDKCPLKSEDMDGYQDDDGCPELDNDLDGILDEDDQCPNEPETFNGFKDEDGCPDERPIEEKFILRGVHFESGSASLTPDSYTVLDQVVKSLLAYPEVRIEIRGYTDNVGSFEYNLTLSQKRAESVRQYLLNSGISPDRLTAKGYSEADPIANNSTPEGRAANRRIEFRRLN
jgi:outer membrane protein OmpA-like peptidoglycan-associated protein